jgi:hypothetical protein
MSWYNAFTPQKYTSIQSKILLQIIINWLNFQTYLYYLQPWGLLAFTWVLRSWKIEQSSQALCLLFFVQHYSRGFISFQIKLRDFFVWHSQIPLYVVFLDPHSLSSLLCGICTSSPRHILLLPFLLKPLWSL